MTARAHCKASFIAFRSSLCSKPTLRCRETCKRASSCCCCQCVMFAWSCLVCAINSAALLATAIAPGVRPERSHPAPIHVVTKGTPCSRAITPASLWYDGMSSGAKTANAERRSPACQGRVTERASSERKCISAREREIKEGGKAYLGTRQKGERRSASQQQRDRGKKKKVYVSKNERARRERKRMSAKEREQGERERTSQQDQMTCGRVGSTHLLDVRSCRASPRLPMVARAAATAVNPRGAAWKRASPCAAVATRL